MGRRKKEPESVHRMAIAAAAEQLFIERSIEATTMDEIAKQAGYSKATLYVYFQNKEEIVAALVLKSMGLLHARLTEAVSLPCQTRKKYNAICQALADYQEQFPLYFLLTLGKIGPNPEQPNCLVVERETYEVGEQINQTLISFLHEGVENGALRPHLIPLSTILVFWASLSGLILMAANKRSYLEQATGLSHDQFLSYGFETLYDSIAVERSEVK